jgi:hypothetical protein
MQIHEVTLPTEYVSNLVKKAGSGLAQAGKGAAKSIAGTTVAKDLIGAVKEPFQKAAAVLDTPGAMTDPRAYSDAMNKYRAGQVAQLEPQVQQQLSAQIAQKTQQRAKQLAQQWAQIIKTQQKPPPASNAQGNSVATDPNWRQDALKSAGVKFPQSESKRRSKSKTSNKNPNWRQDALKSVGAAFDPPPAPRPAPGQMPASVAASKQGKLMLKAYGTPRGGIQNIDEAPQEYTTPSGIVVPGGVKSDQATAPVNDDQFVKWSDQQLASIIPGTRQSISMDMVRQDTELSRTVSDALNKVVKSNNNPQAVEQYFVTAMQAMQRLSAKLKQSGAVPRSSQSTNAGSTGVLDRYVDPTAVQKLKDLAKNPTYAEILKKELGIA